VRPVLTVIGEALVDLVDSGDGRTFTAHPGGSPLNVAVGLARLGHPTAMLARLATDAFGRLLRAHATANSVDLSAAPRAAEPTTLAVASLDDERRAAYDFYLDGTADWQWTADELSNLPAETAVLHTGSLASWTPPGDARIAELVQGVHAGGRTLVSYDPNVRPRLVGTPERGRKLTERFVAAAHVLKASDEDIGWLYPGTTADQVAAVWLDLGARLVVITRGPGGASAYRTGRSRLDRPAPDIELIDTVGAGDALMAGLLSSLAQLGEAARPDLLTSLDDDVIGHVLGRAVLAAAITCERAGADPPTAAELAARMLPQ
jgi:fructokinase